MLCVLFHQHLTSAQLFARKNNKNGREVSDYIIRKKLELSVSVTMANNVTFVPDLKVRVYFCFVLHILVSSKFH